MDDSHQEVVGASASTTPIPRLFHFIWFGGDPPEQYSEYMLEWLNLHPGWGVRVWTDDSVPRLYNQDLFDRAEEIAPNSVGQLKADIVRLEVLYRAGGVYVDFDMEPQHNIEPLLVDIECFFAWEEQDKWINNAIMGCCPMHPFIAYLITGLAKNVDRNKRSRPNVMSGPQYITRKYRDADPDNVNIFPKSLFYPYLYNELHRANEEFPYAYAVHRWNNKAKAAA